MTGGSHAAVGITSPGLVDEAAGIVVDSVNLGWQRVPIRSLVERSKIRRNNSNEAIGNLTISIGVSSYVLAEDPQAFIERADAALYKSKEGGRNRVTAG